MTKLFRHLILRMIVGNSAVIILSPLATALVVAAFRVYEGIPLGGLLGAALYGTGLAMNLLWWWISLVSVVVISWTLLGLRWPQLERSIPTIVSVSAAAGILFGGWVDRHVTGPAASSMGLMVSMAIVVALLTVRGGR